MDPSRGRPRTLVFIGSWTSHSDAADGGVRVFDVGIDGSLTPIGDAVPEISAGDLALSPRGDVLYCADERRDSPRAGYAGGSVASLRIEPATGRLDLLRMAPTGAAFPCQVSASPAGDLVVVANHGAYDFIVRTTRTSGGFTARRMFDSGAISLLPVAPDGSACEPSDVMVLEGRTAGSRAPVLTDPSGQFTGEFQASSHPHAAVFHPTEPVLVVPDKGTDSISVLEVDPVTRRLTLSHRSRTAAGTGPRHARFHPTLPVVYVVHELVPSMSVHAWDADSRRLRPIQTIATIPGSHDGVVWPSELLVHPAGSFVHVTNRGHDSIATFPVRADGTLDAPRLVASGGHTPRAFGIDPGGTWMFVLNQGSGTVVTFALDADGGAPEPTGAVAAVERPVSIAMGRY